MTLENGSASASERTIACPASLALPRVHTTNRYAEAGHERHAFFNAVFSGKPLADALALIDDPQILETCRRVDWKKLCGDLEELESEMAYALDVKARTARFLGKDLGRNYGELGPWEVPGTLDIQGIGPDYARVVIDIKSGYQDVTDVEDNGQALFFAAVFMLLEQRDHVEVRISKLKRDGAIWNDVAMFSAWDVDNYLDKYEAALERSREARRVYLAGGVPDLSEGPWCGYCGAADSCPAKTRLARAMISELAPLESRIEAMTPDEKRAAWTLAHDRALPLVTRVVGLLKESARREPFDVSDDEELREAPYQTTKPDFKAAIDLAESLGATPAQIRACHKSVTVRQVAVRKIPRVKLLRRKSA